jgi:hypothetical protein
MQLVYAIAKTILIAQKYKTEKLGSINFFYMLFLDINFLIPIK